MQRYVLRFRGPAAPDDQVLALRSRVKVLDSSPRLLLIETDGNAVEALKAEFPDWLFARESTYRVPEKPVRAVKRPRA